MKKQDITENQAKKVYLALGSNLGNKRKNLELAKFHLNQLGINILKTSKYYKTKSWPNKNFPDFINIILIVNSSYKFRKIFIRFHCFIINKIVLILNIYSFLINIFFNFMIITKCIFLDTKNKRGTLIRTPLI